jgi:hypothetical protein
MIATIITQAEDGIVNGEVDIADLLFLVAFVVLVVVAVIHAVARSVTGTLLAAGLACMALAWLVL